jgi:hypothetical protein
MGGFIFRVLAQAFLAALLAWGVWICADLLGFVEVGHSFRDAVVVQIVRPAIIALVAILAGAGICAQWKEMSPTAVWVWISPVALFVIVVGLSAWATGMRGLDREYFFWHPGSGDEPPLGAYVFTYPAISALSYSAGALVSTRLGGRRT